MKKILLTSLVFAALNLSAYEVNFNKAFTKEVHPDVLRTTVYVNVNKKEENEVGKLLEKFNNFFKNIKRVQLKNGSSSISPKYKYKKDETIFSGYNGHISYQVQSTSAKEINDFISNFVSLNNQINSDDVKIQVSNIRWEVSSQLYNKNADEMRLETILWANNYGKQLSKEISHNCKIKKININSDQRNVYYEQTNRVYSSKMKSFKSDVAPVRNDKKITINSNFTMECK